MDRSNLFKQMIQFINAVHEMTYEFSRHVKHDSTTDLQYKILEYVYLNQPITPSEISNCLYISLPNTSRELKKLQQLQLIQKEADIEDRRKLYITLSEQGQAAMNASFAAIEQQFQAKLEHVSDKELDDIQKAVQLLQNKVFQ